MTANQQTLFHDDPDDHQDNADNDPQYFHPRPLSHPLPVKTAEQMIIDGRLRISTTGHWVTQCHVCHGWDLIELMRHRTNKHFSHDQGIHCLSFKAEIDAGEYNPRFLGRWNQK